MTDPNPQPAPSGRLAALAGLWEISETRIDLSAAAVFKAIPADPMRWSFSIGTSTGGVFIATTQPPSGVPNNWGYLVGSPPFERNYRDHGAAVQLAWYINQPGAGIGFAFLQVVRWKG